jgi:hypothetical protein
MGGGGLEGLSQEPEKSNLDLYNAPIGASIYCYLLDGVPRGHVSVYRSRFFLSLL